jgi:pyruvate dehydrogenase E1 component beta subunit
MGQRTLAETIKEITRKHLEENDGILLGQCISAVGWVNNTVPDTRGIVELPMSDTAGAGIAVGAAMVGKRPIFVIRFQDFLMLNGSPLVNYAAKCKELHGASAPVFIRALASEGLGPVHSGVLHSVFMHFPGMRVCSPMTPGEYEQAWQMFIENDDPILVSEHRESFRNTEEMADVVNGRADITLFAISCTRFAAIEAADMLAKEGIDCNIVHIVWLKPFEVTDKYLEPLSSSQLGLVVDPTFEICGASRSIAYELADASGRPVKALGLADTTKCLCPPYQNRAPDAQKIYDVVKCILK